MFGCCGSGEDSAVSPMTADFPPHVGSPSKLCNLAFPRTDTLICVSQVG